MQMIDEEPTAHLGIVDEDKERLRRPGFGLPLNHLPEDLYEPDHIPAECQRFPHALLDWEARALTVRERMMMVMVNDITDKDEWTRKVSDEDIVDKWRKEAVNDFGDERTEAQREEFGQGFTNEMFEFCIRELRYKATICDTTGMTLVLDTDAGVVKSDSAISPDLNRALRAAVKPLEDVPDIKKDWHPGSDKLVLDLVHPSLFPLVYGRSRVIPQGVIGLEDCLQKAGSGELAETPEEEDAVATTLDFDSQELFSTKFQWLPCEVRLTEDENVEITSYINNLHPVQHKALYEVLERIIKAAIPLWSLAIGYTRGKEETQVRDGKWSRDDMRIPCAGGQVWANFKWNPSPDHPDNADSEKCPEDIDSADYFQMNSYGRAMAKRILVMPQPREYTDPPPAYPIDMRNDFPNGLQVIVKLANVMLTPEKPHYAGGSWHIEGQLNERICATALYYYDSENITDSHLAFRQRIEGEHIISHYYGQDDYGGVEFIYGVDCKDGMGVQDVGRVCTREGRLISFPNVLQHRVQPFGLQDQTRPGHRKIVALFLVDPWQRVLSTANVAPQQKEWWANELREDGSLSAFPEELAGQILEEVGSWPMDSEEAKALRLELMEERRGFRRVEEEVIGRYCFNFCEH